MKRVAIFITLSVVAVAVVSCAKSKSPVAVEQKHETISYVTDDAEVIDESSKQQLETILAELKARKSIDFSIVTVKTTGNQPARDYSLALARERRSKSKDETVSGLLLLVAIDDRNWHVQVTRNLEDKLTGEILTNLSEPMTTSFQQNRYADGIIQYVKALIAKLEQLGYPAN